MATRLETGISQASWCCPRRGGAHLVPAEIAIGGEAPQTVAWLDKLFDGGILLPDGAGRALTFLLAGPPGSGKTTLALELCYRLAKTTHLNSLYISTDSESCEVIGNARSYGWTDVGNYVLPYDGQRPNAEAAVTVWGRERIQQWETLADLVSTAVEEVALGPLKVKPQPFVKRVIKRGEKPPAKVSESLQVTSPAILVIDSLNVVEPDRRADLFRQFVSVESSAAKLVVLVLDSPPNSPEPRFWEYLCDIVVRLDYAHDHDYYVRTLEIVKARYQQHVWGRHQLKIYGDPQLPASATDARTSTRLRRAHPYRREGGIFVYPSIHYYLSLYKRQRPTEAPADVETYPEELNRVVKLPKGRCTAFIGERGGHKSHLGWVHLLSRLLHGHREGALIVSLRDDEQMARDTMSRILEQQFQRDNGNGSERAVDGQDTLAMLEDNDRLEILYYPPGYITPEEFFHRMFMSIHRLKRANDSLTVLFNSVDQLSARFPLCAKQGIFIPGIIEALTGEGITSIFVAVEEPGQPAEQYGLLPMADLILSFRRRWFSFRDYLGHLEEAGRLDGASGDYLAKVQTIKSSAQDTRREAIVLQVERFFGGQKAGAKGLLELVDRHTLAGDLYSDVGLHFTPLSPRYREGHPIRTN